MLMHTEDMLQLQRLDMQHSLLEITSPAAAAAALATATVTTGTTIATATATASTAIVG